jgi:hypothetical protein
MLLIYDLHFKIALLEEEKDVFSSKSQVGLVLVLIIIPLFLAISSPDGVSYIKYY